jgi:hypothetical protein
MTTLNCEAVTGPTKAESVPTFTVTFAVAVPKFVPNTVATNPGQSWVP